VMSGQVLCDLKASDEINIRKLLISVMFKMLHSKHT
jgi:hypothetical protein